MWKSSALPTSNRTSWAFIHLPAVLQLRWSSFTQTAKHSTKTQSPKKWVSVFSANYLCRQNGTSRQHRSQPIWQKPNWPKSSIDMNWLYQGCKNVSGLESTHGDWIVACLKCKYFFGNCLSTGWLWVCEQQKALMVVELCPQRHRTSDGMGLNWH